MLTPHLAPMAGVAQESRRGLHTSYVWVVWPRAAADVAIGILYFVLAIRSDAWQLYTSAGLAFLAVALDLAALGLMRRARLAPGAWLLIGGLLAAVLANAILLEGFGVTAVFAAIALTSLAAAQLLPAPQVGRAVIASVIVGVLSLLADVYMPATAVRLMMPPEARVAVPVIITLLAADYCVLVIRRFAGYPLSTKLILSFLAVALAPLTLLAFINSRSARATLIDEANQKLFAAAALTATSLDSFMTINLATINEAAQLPVWRQYLALPPAQRDDSPEQREAISVLIGLQNSQREQVSSFVQSFALLDRDGQVALDTALFPTPPSAIRLNMADRGFIQAALSSLVPSASPVEFSQTTNQPSIYFAAPILGRRRESFGVLLVRFNAAILQELIAANNGLAGRDSFAVLFDENLIHLAHGIAPETLYTVVGQLDSSQVAALQESRRLPNWPAEKLSMAMPLLEENLANPDDQPYFSAEDIATGDRLNQVVLSALTTQSWQVAFFQPQDVFLAPAEAQTQTTILLAVLLAGVVAIMATAVARQLTAPVVSLTAAAARVAAGDLTVQAPAVTGDEIGTLATTFNSMTVQLRQMLLELEQRVAERTRELEASAQISRRLSTILERDVLLAQVVEQIRSAFAYYHAQIYLLDDSGQALVLAGATGQAGHQLMLRSHSVPRSKGLVGLAASSNQTVLVPDVFQNPNWLPNALLPETRAEAAVPISSAEQVLGVLDVQHNVVGGLKESDAALLRSIADQVAIALQNARLFERLQRQARHEAVLNKIGQKIQRATSLEGVLQIAVQELGRALQAQRSSVQLSLSARSTNGREE